MRNVTRREWARAVGFVLAWSIALEGPGFHALAAAPPSSAAKEEIATRFASQLRASLQALEDGDREAPRDRWDPAYVVDTVGLEPAALLAWVRSSVRWVPYRGALRGATGVLMDRVGNGLDQALLMAELLRAAGKTPRLAHADLANATATDTWRRIVRPVKFAPAPPPPPPSAAPAAPPSDVLASADLYGIDRASVASIVGTARKDAEDMARELRTRVDDQLERLTKAAGLPVVTASAGASPEQLAALADHWWAEYRDGSKWVAVDPLADGGVGASLAPATRTAEPDALPTELEQLVTIRVVTEQTKGNVRKEGVPIEHTFAARGVIGERIQVQHFPMAWPRDWPQVGPDHVQIKLRAAFLTQNEWLPIVRVGTQGYNRAAVRDTGEIDETPAPANPFQTMMVPATGQLAKATDVLATIGDEDGAAAPPKEKAPDKEARAEGELTAEWLEIEFAAPGAPPRKVRREIFDLIGPAARAAGGAAAAPLVMTEERTIARSMALLGEAEIQVLPCRLSPDFAMHLAAQNAGANRELLDEMANDPFSKLPPNYLETFGKLTPLPAALLAHALVRFEGNPYAAALYVDRPAVVIQHTTLSRGKGGDFFGQAGLDIVENGVGVDPRVGVAASQARMAQGIADTNAEIAAMRRLGEPAVNTAEAFAADIKAGRAWTALKPGDESKAAKLGLPADVAQRIALELKAGFAVVAPSGGGDAAASAGWWRIDPTTGATLGIGPTGHGQALVEYALVIVIQTIIATAQCMIANAASKALVRAMKDRSARAPIEAAKEGYEQAKESWAKADGYKCVANGMLSGLDLMVMMWTMKPFSMFGPGEAEVKRPEVPLYEGEKPVSGGGEKPPSGGSKPPGERPPEKPPAGSGEKPPEPRGPEPRGQEPLDLKPKPERKGQQDLDKARQDREQKQKKVEEAREKLDRAEDEMAREHGNPPKNLDDVQRRNSADEALEKAQKEYDEARRQERYSREREYLAQTEKEAFETAQRKAAADAAYQDHVNKGGAPQGPVYDEWKQANEADKQARADWMNARFGQLPGDKPPASAGGGSAPAPAPGAPSPGAGSVPPPGGSPMAGSVGPSPGAGSAPSPAGSPMAGSVGPAPSGSAPPPTTGQTAPGIGVPGTNKGAQSGNTIPGVQVPDVVRHIPPDQSPVGMNPFGETVPAMKSPLGGPPPEPPPAAMAGAAGLSSTMKLLTVPAP